MSYLGIDPGISESAPGALAVVDYDGSSAIMDMPVVDKMVDCAHIVRWLETFGPLRAVIEVQQSMPAQSSTSGFKLGQCYGALLAVLQVLEISYEALRPTTWKKAMGVAGTDKEKDRAMAMRLFPTASLSRVKDHGRADALLLAELARRRYLSFGAVEVMEE